MSLLLLLAQAVVQVPAGGIPQRIPPTSWDCKLTLPDGAYFHVSGTTPDFPAGSDPNGMKMMRAEAHGLDALDGMVGVTPGDASDYFRDFQVQSRGKKGEAYNLNLKLRRVGTSVAYSTLYVSTGKPIPYDYHAAGLCAADFAGGPLPERGQP